MSVSINIHESDESKKSMGNEHTEHNNTNNNTNTNNTHYDVIIVGAGISGCTLAYLLGKQGRSVLLVERDLSEPDRIVGELMQPAGVDKLCEIGLGDCFQGIDAAEAYGYGVYRKGESTRLPYPAKEKGYSFHHGRFVMKLRGSAELTLGVKLIQGTVTSLLENGTSVFGVVYKKSGDENPIEVFAPLTVICDGCSSNFRRGMISEVPKATSHFVGLIIKDCEVPFPNHGHVFLTEPSPILLYQIGTNEHRVLVDVPNPLPSASNGDLSSYLEEKTAPQLPDSVRESFLKAVRETRPRSMPNNILHPQPNAKNGVLLLGDSWNMRHPLTGGGMTVAIKDADLLSKTLKLFENFSDQAAVVKAIQTNFYNKRSHYAATINILATALYKVFSASDDETLPDMREGCLTYFRLGGVFASGPICLLSGLSPSPLRLVAHFFSVAVVGVLRVLLPFPTPKKVFRAYRLLCAAANIVVPLIKKEHVLKWVPVVCRLLTLVKSDI